MFSIEVTDFGVEKPHTFFPENKSYGVSVTRRSWRLHFPRKKTKIREKTPFDISLIPFVFFRGSPAVSRVTDSNVTKSAKRSFISVRDVFPVRAFSQPEGGVAKRMTPSRFASRSVGGSDARRARNADGKVRLASRRVPEARASPGARRAARARGRATASFASSSFLFQRRARQSPAFAASGRARFFSAKV